MPYPEGLHPELDRSSQIGRRGDPELALRHALAVREATTDEACVAAASQQMAWFCFQLGDVEQGLTHAYFAREIWRKRDDAVGQAWAGAIHAWLLLEAGLTAEATEDALAALGHAERAGDLPTLAFATNVLGVIFWYCKQLERALDLCQQAVNVARQVGDPSALSWWLINLAGVHSEFGYRADRAGDGAGRTAALGIALAINQEAIVLAESQGDIWCQRLGLCNAAEYLAADGRTEAVEAIERCERLPGPVARRSTGHYLYTKAQVLIRLERLQEALPVCQQALELSEAAKAPDVMAYALRYLSEIYERLGQFEQALACFKRFHDTHSILAAETTQRHARIAEIRYQVNKFRVMADAEQRRADRLAVAASHDPLTGIANRRRFDEALLRLATKNTPYAIAMIDLDHFKRVNDRFSHQIGDEVLKRVAAVLKDACRSDDLVARLGGEEFAILIDAADAQGARRFCLALRKSLTAVAWNEVHAGLRVTASIGVATNLEAAGPQAVLALADARLYNAKLSGRDRVISWAAAETPSLAD